MDLSSEDAYAGQQQRSSGTEETGPSLGQSLLAAGGPVTHLYPCMKPGCSMKLSGPSSIGYVCVPYHKSPAPQLLFPADIHHL